MSIKAKLDQGDPNTMLTSSPMSKGNIASYILFVRQNGAIVEGKYILDDVPSSDYSSITCVYYNGNNEEISRRQSNTQPGYCWVQDHGNSSLNVLEMQVHGVSSPPVGGSIDLDGSYTPAESEIPDLGGIFGKENSEFCTTMPVNSTNLPKANVKFNETSGVLTWNIVPRRFDPTALVRVQKVYVSTMDDGVGVVTVVPYVRGNDGKPVALDSYSGTANKPIEGFPADYTTNIFYLLVIIAPIDPKTDIDPDQLMIGVDYCASSDVPVAPSMLDAIQPYFSQDDANNNMNAPIRRSPVLLLG